MPHASVVIVIGIGYKHIHKCCNIAAVCHIEMGTKLMIATSVVTMIITMTAIVIVGLNYKYSMIINVSIMLLDTAC